MILPDYPIVVAKIARATPSADKQTHNYEPRVLKPPSPSLPINSKVKGIE